MQYKILRSKNSKTQIYSKKKRKRFNSRRKIVMQTILIVGNLRYRGCLVKVK